MADITLKILESPGTLVKDSRDNVIVHEYEGKKYYVKKLLVDEKSFKILLSFKLLEFMGVKTPNITTYIEADNYDINDKYIYIISEECGKVPVGHSGILPENEYLRKEIAKIIYVADLLGLGDISMDNIIQSGDTLFLIDFEALNTNNFFRPQNPFKKTNGDEYSVARSFDYQNTKGDIKKINKLLEKEVLSDLKLDETLKKEIEEKFFSLSQEKIQELIFSVLNEQLSEEYISDKVIKITKELEKRCEELCDSRKKLETDIKFEIAKPTPLVWQGATVLTDESTAVYLTRVHKILEEEKLMSGLCGKPTIGYMKRYILGLSNKHKTQKTILKD